MVYVWFFMPWIVVTTKLLLLISIVGYQEKLWEFMEWSLQDMKSPDNVTLFEKTKNVKNSWNA